MKWYKSLPPVNGEPFLACLGAECSTPYCILKFDVGSNAYVEVVEEYWQVRRKDILAWTTMEELDNDCFGN